MTEKKSHSVYKSEIKESLFDEQFDLWESSNWNNDMPHFFKRLNQIDDDRSFVILATSVLEFQVNRFLKCFIPESQILVNFNTNFATKLNIIKAFNLIPKQFPNMIDCIKSIRNEFAHTFEIDSFDDANESTKLPNHLKDLDRFWTQFESDMCYWKKGEPLRLKFKDIWRVTIEGLRAYESNVRLFRQETEKVEFIDHLMTLSTELRDLKEQDEREAVLKRYMPWRK